MNYITKAEEEIVLSCNKHVNMLSIARMLNMPYANVYHVICVKHGFRFESRNSQRKYPYVRKINVKKLA